VSKANPGDVSIITDLQGSRTFVVFGVGEALAMLAGFAIMASMPDLLVPGIAVMAVGARHSRLFTKSFLHSAFSIRHVVAETFSLLPIESSANWKSNCSKF